MGLSYSFGGRKWVEERHWEKLNKCRASKVKCKD